MKDLCRPRKKVPYKTYVTSLQVKLNLKPSRFLEWSVNVTLEKLSGDALKHRLPSQVVVDVIAQQVLTQ